MDEHRGFVLGQVVDAGLVDVFRVVAHAPGGALRGFVNVALQRLRLLADRVGVVAADHALLVHGELERHVRAGVAGLGRRDLVGQGAEHRVVLQQVRERRGAGEVVDGNEVDGLVTHRCTHDVAPDSPEPVDPDFDGHSCIASTSLVEAVAVS